MKHRRHSPVGDHHDKAELLQSLADVSAYADEHIGILTGELNEIAEVEGIDDADVPFAALVIGLTVGLPPDRSAPKPLPATSHVKCQGNDGGS